MTPPASDPFDPPTPSTVTSVAPAATGISETAMREAGISRSG